ncbi:glutamate--cysteine ligase [Nocardioides sp. zg-536]|uniref:Putative glutamate--cysteine ligase 2 n=1 Tax=Nocardioides faecalis TaxID=2803858 RepID=A0A938Y8L7_9ACTN|nr:glutamate--cysteine ligase [Nocardioides faecalis]MBM9459486.1 glutamate--cysteine ligase [Nocardioides faecalis]MBS4751727.1 glutamate--cysteine ligase [Nocardioides faecalis]QVI59413.1 glutamate--cysteine ligase [Nocardioides faecalis]
MRIDFHGSPEPTLGVEWEFGLVDRRTRDLRNDAAHLFARAKARMPEPEKLHKELLKNTVEVVTGICPTVGDALTDLRTTLHHVTAAADDLGLDLYGAGTHPFASWTSQELSEGHRYEELINRTQWWGRQMLIWGVHVHVGMAEKSRVLPVLSALLTYYPHLQALSASSPIWAGVDTGYASNRALMFQQLPTAGLPFQFETWAEFEHFAHDQVTTGVIDDLSEIRWDVRPATRHGTLENRICDGVSTLSDMGALVALMHCLVVWLDDRLAAGEKLPTLPPWHVQENKWRAARYGVDAIVILDADSNERLVTDDLADLLVQLEPTAERLGCAAELAAVPDLLTRGPSYVRQREVAARTGGDLVAVVDSVATELRDELDSAP